MTEVCISLHDSTNPDDDYANIQFYSDVIPRVGDSVCYWVDYPKHMPDQVNPGPHELQKVTGIVSHVLIDYRYMRGWGSNNKLHTIVGVWLDNYESFPFVFDI